MSEQITIKSLTANTPVDIYYCDAMSASCVYVSTVATFPFVFDVPVPYCDSDFIIKIVDTQGCELGLPFPITPTPTPSFTPTPTISPTQTLTQTQTPTVSPTQSPSNTPNLTSTPTQTPTISVTPNIASHAVGQGCTDRTWPSSGECCNDHVTIQNYYTYIAEANLVPVVGAKVYTVQNNSVLYSPFNGGSNWLLMEFNGNNYSVQIDSSGIILDYGLC